MFNRLKTKVQQKVGDAQKTEWDPTFKQAIVSFGELSDFGIKIRDATQEALPSPSGSSKQTKNEQLGFLVKQAASKYGSDKPEYGSMTAFGDVYIAIGKEERNLLQKVEQECYSRYKKANNARDALKKQRSDLEKVTTDMDGAVTKEKSGKADGGIKDRAQSATRAFEAQKKVVGDMAATITQQRDEQRAALKALAEAQRDFYLQSAQLLENAIANL